MANEREITMEELQALTGNFTMSNPKKENKFEVSEWNVIDDETFKKRIEDVFHKVANALSKTLGPYGSTTIIERFGEMYVTKDGWQVLKSINFANPIDKNIMSMLVRIATQVVLKVGDGSTSSIMAADKLLHELNSADLLSTMRPKEFINSLDRVVGKISDEIYANAKKVNTDTLEEIYKLAYISTNGDEEISNIIREIYKETGNPSIEYVKSKDDTTRYEIVNGYKAKIGYLDNIFQTQDDGNAVINNPYVLTFNYKIDTGNSLRFIAKAIQYAVTHGNRQIVIVAPNYDKHLNEYLQHQVIMEMKDKRWSQAIYTRVSLVNNLSHDLYNDFIVMCGCNVLNEETVENMDPEAIDDTVIENYIGEVGTFTVNDRTALIQDLYKMNENMYTKILSDATAKYNKLEQDSKDRSIVDTSLNEVKQRLAKLKGSMGIIHVGGYTTIEKGANYDLVEDAVKACESAYTNGYNIGGSLIIPCMINKLKYGPEMLSMQDAKIMDLIKEAFLQVFRHVLMNKYGQEETDAKFDEIVSHCIENGIGYDLITDEYSTDIINSCVADVEILKAAASIISLLISSNQYVSIQTQ